MKALLLLLIFGLAFCEIHPQVPLPPQPLSDQIPQEFNPKNIHQEESLEPISDASDSTDDSDLGEDSVGISDSSDSSDSTDSSDSDENLHDDMPLNQEKDSDSSDSSDSDEIKAEDGPQEREGPQGFGRRRHHPHPHPPHPHHHGHGRHHRWHHPRRFEVQNDAPSPMNPSQAPDERLSDSSDSSDSDEIRIQNGPQEGPLDFGGRRHHPHPHPHPHPRPHHHGHGRHHRWHHPRRFDGHPAPINPGQAQIPNDNLVDAPKVGADGNPFPHRRRHGRRHWGGHEKGHPHGSEERKGHGPRHHRGGPIKRFFREVKNYFRGLFDW